MVVGREARLHVILAGRGVGHQDGHAILAVGYQDGHVIFAGRGVGHRDGHVILAVGHQDGLAERGVGHHVIVAGIGGRVTLV